MTREDFLKILSLIRFWENWEAELIQDSAAWAPMGMAEHPTIIEPHYSKLLELQQARNEIKEILETNFASTSAFWEILDRAQAGR